MAKKQIFSSGTKESAFRQQGIPFHLLSRPLVQKKAWEASGQSRSIEAASGIPDSGGRTGTAACDLCFGLPDASGKAHDNGAEAAGRA